MGVLDVIGESGVEPDRLQSEQDGNVIQANSQTLKMWRKTGVMANSVYMTICVSIHVCACIHARVCMYVQVCMCVSVLQKIIYI